jgi:hypothetical protein
MRIVQQFLLIGFVRCIVVEKCWAQGLIKHFTEGFFGPVSLISLS